MFGNALVITWRESLEAVLVVSILYTCLRRMDVEPRAFRYLWQGIAAGLGLSVLLAFAYFHVQSELQGNALEVFQTGMVLFAAGLITHMVFWMQKYGRFMKRQLEQNLQQAMTTSGMIGVATVAALAVAREGVETVVFLYGLGSAAGPAGLNNIFAGAGLGFVLAFATAWLVGQGVRWLNYRVFFKVSGVLLLLFACSLLVVGTNRMIEAGFIPALIEPVWDSSFLLDEQSVVGGTLAAFTGYRSHPSLMLVLVVAFYWLFAVLGLKRQSVATATSFTPTLVPVPSTESSLERS